MATESPARSPTTPRLDSWKEIASYLGRDVRTVQRWEKKEALPVHRHQHDKQGTVYAFPSELDAWWVDRRPRLGGDQAEPGADPDTPAGRRPIALWIAAGAAALVLAVAAFLIARGSAGVPSIAPIRSIVVLPLENLTGDPQQEYFADGMTDALIADLGHISALRVISRTSAMQYKGARKKVSAIAGELNVDGVVEGSVRRSNGRVLVAARLIRAATEQQLWNGSYEGDVKDIVTLQNDVARAVAREINIQITSREQGYLALARPVDPVAYEDYLRGRYALNKRTEEGFTRGLEDFQRAIAANPQYALAHAGLADAYLLLGAGDYGAIAPKEAMPKAKAAAERALALDESLAEAHATLGLLHYIFDWDWPAAEQEYRRAIDMNPGYPAAHQWYALYLTAMGRTTEAIAEARRAQALDPLSLIINTDLGVVFYRARQYDTAIATYRKTLEIEPDFVTARWELGRALVQSGAHADGIAELDRAVRLSDRNPVYLAALGHAYAVAGRTADAKAVLAELETLSRRRFVLPNLFVLIHAGLGNTDQAFTWLERAFDARSDFMIALKVEPALDPLRSDPRFAAMLKKMRLD